MMNICEAIEYMKSGSDKFVQTLNDNKRACLAYSNSEGVHWRSTATNKFESSFIYTESSFDLEFEVYKAEKNITHLEALARLFDGEIIEDRYGTTYRLIKRKIVCRLPNSTIYEESYISFTDFISRDWHTKGE